MKVLLSLVAITSVSLAGCYPRPAEFSGPDVYTGSHSGHEVEVIETGRSRSITLKNAESTSWVDGAGSVQEGTWKPESIHFHGAPFCEAEDFVIVRIERQYVADIDRGSTCQGEMTFGQIWETVKSLEEARLVLRNDVGSLP